MADEELELDVKEGGGGKKKLIMIIVGILLLNGIGVGAWMFLGGGGEDKKSSHAEAAPKVVLGPLTYLTMVPEFVVNFGPGSKVRYLQVDLQVSTRQEKSLDTVRTYRPVIRNDILVVLSDVSYEDLIDRAGKEALRKKLLDAINKVVVSAEHASSNDSKKDGHANDDEKIKGPIENVYYTSFIMQ